MRLVDHDGKVAASMLIPDYIQDEREGLNRGDNDFLSFAQKFPQLLGLRNARALLNIADCRSNLRKLFDRFTDLLIENSSVRDNNDRIEKLLAVFAQPDQLMRQPGD